MILSGEKREEYRDIQPYYRSRFSNAVGDDITSEVLTIKVRFRNGYCSYSPSFIALCQLYVDYGVEVNGKIYSANLIDMNKECLIKQEKVEL